MYLTLGGIDPSLRNFGFAKATYDTISDTWGVHSISLQQTENESGKTVRKSSDDFRCAGLLHDATQTWVKDCSVVFGEVPSGAQSARASFGLGIALAVLAGVGTVGSEFKGRLIQVNALDVKRLAVGSKNASKPEMIEWAMTKWPDLPWLTRKVKGEVKPIDKNEHMADACAVINAGIQTDEFKALIQTLKILR